MVDLVAHQCRATGDPSTQYLPKLCMREGSLPCTGRAWDVRFQSVMYPTLTRSSPSPISGTGFPVAMVLAERTKSCSFVSPHSVLYLLLQWVRHRRHAYRKAMHDGLVSPLRADSARYEITISITQIPERGARDHRMGTWM